MAVVPCTCNRCRKANGETAMQQPLRLVPPLPTKGYANPDCEVRFLPVERAAPTPLRYQWPAWQFWHARGIGYARFHGWGVQWRDTRTNPPSAGTRAQWTKIGIGPYLIRLLRP